ncbi:MAG TPA: phytanoyl-CoA dioxygenase family protein [Paraburkholderia sp.]|nr:phytanoyl-CoA dioxygenase family protein [Paraburkholderia sp.]
MNVPSTNVTAETFDTAFDHYQAHGYAIVPGLLDAGLTAALRALTDRLMDEAVDDEDRNALFDFEGGLDGGKATVQRIKKPHRVDPFYFELAKHPALLEFIQRVVGQGVRLNHSKINVKAARVGSSLEWHQDWAFAPHTNMSTCVASVMIDDAYIENGAMQVLPGSHKGPLYRHHDAYDRFVGAIDPSTAGLDFSSARPLVGNAGTVAFHHPMTIHGSGLNRSGSPRRILFLEYAAIDAWPLFYHVDWQEYNSRIVAGEPTSEVRVEPNRLTLPFPSEAGSSIYKTQSAVRSRFFDTVANAS